MKIIQTTIENQNIVEYYDNCQVDYSIVWHLKTHLSLHYGYWDQNTKRLRQALIKMNDVLAQKIQIKKSDRVLDAGCGVGGSAIYLAKKYECRVDGITLSKNQAEFASAKAFENNLNHKVCFRVADFTKMPFEDNTFDVVWAIESVCHANDKADFLKEAFRVLKKGGRIIIADFFRTMESPDVSQNKLLNNWGETWAVPHFEYIKLFEKKALETGFSGLQTQNITQNIRPSAERLYYCFVPGVICDGFLRFFGKRNQLHKANVWSTYYQYKSLKQDLWNYYIFSAEKKVG